MLNRRGHERSSAQNCSRRSCVISRRGTRFRPVNRLQYCRSSRTVFFHRTVFPRTVPRERIVSNRFADSTYTRNNV